MTKQVTIPKTKPPVFRKRNPHRRHQLMRGVAGTGWSIFFPFLRLNSKEQKIRSAFRLL
ncbi:MAG: hypothetical protein P4L62_00675 [Candidatus Pacebacteria bacterium]|nr:hypothetical protein [Candidatus Paceibacterota bacterium]MDR3582863.1 hypothetical protein [Candidatus Paceibacterota bacterium]